MQTELINRKRVREKSAGLARYGKARTECMLNISNKHTCALGEEVSIHGEIFGYLSRKPSGGDRAKAKDSLIQPVK